MVLGLRTAIYPAPDLAAAKRWYTDMLGVAPYFDEPFYVGFSVGGFELGLLPNATPGTVGPQPLWGVADIGSAYSRLIELGASPLEPITVVGGEVEAQQSRCDRHCGPSHSAAAELLQRELA